MQAIILAAGMGKRLKELTKENTKCMVKVNGTTLIERMLRQLDRYGLRRIILVIGYKGDCLKEFVSSLEGVKTPILYVINSVYNQTNNIYSLALAKKYLLEEDTILLESDLIFEDRVLDMLLEDPRDTLALVDKYESWMSGTMVKLSERDEILDFVPGKNFDFKDTSQYYKTVNVYKFSKTFSQNQYVPFLESYLKALGSNEYYEQVLRVITLLDHSWIRAKRVHGAKWYEIDDVQDLDIASSIFAEPDEALPRLQRRYGGYWRYPQMLDFCYLVNPYFPPHRLVEELSANFEKLLTQYPSGMEVNSLLAAKNFGVQSEYILVGNGAAELIKSLMSGFEGKLGIIQPTFEEYPHRYDSSKIINYWPDSADFRYTADDLIEFFSKNKVNNLIVINPDNPSGNYIPRDAMLRLISWTKEQGIKLVVDESFSDFADEPENTLMDMEILENNPHLYVMKSISKSYGVPGLRLGVLASGNFEAISRMKKDVSIWNINSFAEYYMQIEEKYKDDFLEAMRQFREERKRYIQNLSQLDGIRIIPSQANYVMAEITNGMSASELTRSLLVKHGILIKDLSSKISERGKQYVRLAISSEEENDMLISALKQELVE